MRDAAFGPGQEVELGDSPCLSSFHVFKVEAANQVVVAPHVLAHQVHLYRIKIVLIQVFIEDNCESRKFTS